MGSLNDRIKRLEARMVPPGPVASPERDAAYSAYFKDLDAQRREGDGLPPDPANEPTVEELKAELAFMPEWVAYLENEMARASPSPGSDLHDALADFVALAASDAEELEAEIAKREERHGLVE